MKSKFLSLLPSGAAGAGIFLAFVVASQAAMPRERGEGPWRSAAGAAKPAPTPVQKQNLVKLQADLAAIQAGSNVTTTEKQQLAATLAACADGATKPSKASVQTLSDSLSSALSDKTVTTKEKARIAAAVQGVLTSASIPAAEVEALVASVQAVLKASGVSREILQVVVNDLRAIGAELKNNAPARP